MRLERLEINGFKSFSDRAELAFDQGVTAIVGPNGCGKSNVADAITWVLGEQSAKSLRGDRMEDVIFSGSDVRKPGAAAEVRLRLTGLPVPPKDDTADSAGVAAVGYGPAEFCPAGANGNGHGSTGNGGGKGHSPSSGVVALADGRTLAGPSAFPDLAGDAIGARSVAELASFVSRDVEVTRRLYRFGESEYLIDGEVCRLRDVHDLLMDTGLGAKAYAIIEQGKIGMILNSRPTDRRQLIEEAAGITKYKSRRRAAELKLEAAQQNLIRIDDIVFEIERQRGVLKRQAGKARRYTRLREELRRWEKVLFAGRYRDLALSIEGAQVRLADARARETAAAGRVAEVEADLARLRIEQAEAARGTTQIREAAHARELDITRRRQQQEFNRQQAEAFAARTAEIAGELQDLEARREPGRIAVDACRAAAAEAVRAREDAERVLADAMEAHVASQQRIEGLESDVEAARADVFAALNAATALRHAMEHASVQRDRVGATLDKLELEHDDLRLEVDTVEMRRRDAADMLARALAALEEGRIESVTRGAELAGARAEHEAGLRLMRTREQELAGLEARLISLEELSASRAEFGDAARMVLVQANGRVGQQGAVADYVDVDPRYERAVEACLGDLLQHVIVERHDQAEAGLAIVREHDAGRCGFVVVDPRSNGFHPREALRVPGITPVSEVVRIAGPHAEAIQKVVPEAYIADTFNIAAATARQTVAPVATLDGDVFRGPHLVSGGAKAESRGILATKREIKNLRERVSVDRDEVTRLAQEASGVELAIIQATTVLAGLSAERHRQEKAIVAREADVAHATEEALRLDRKGAVIALERRQTDEERTTLEARLTEAEASIGRLLDEQQRAECHLAEIQKRLLDARGAVDALSSRTADARASHAAMLERASALAAEVDRLEEGARDLEQRIAAYAAELEQTRGRRAALLQAIADEDRNLNDDILALDGARQDVRGADEAAADLRVKVDAQDAMIRDARRGLEDARSQASELDLLRATAHSDLSHLAQTCIDTTLCSLDQVLAEVEQMEQAGEATPDGAAITAEEPDPDTDESESFGGGSGGPVDATASMTAEDAIAALKAKVDRLGPVNMMAIEQFDELETRHTFLTTQCKDLIDSIAQTTEAIRRIDETSTARFNEAFSAIQQNFQVTFGTLFGGGRGGLTLLDENDPLESGIDIVASPPGKRLQSVQLLSGGEKALTAIALMFAIFRYKPSPFCLLDEIDASLDDANVGRFVEMLQGMLDRTQFILITHNRRTMEIANRLYGVTMEEPGVSKLISVQLN